MSAPSRPPLVKRLPPGAWLLVVWCAVNIGPLTGGLQQAGPFGAHLAFLPSTTITLVALLPGTVALRRWPQSGLALLLTGTIAAVLALNMHAFPLAGFLPVVMAVGYVAATRDRMASVPSTVTVLLGSVAFSLAWLPLERANPLIITLTTLVAWLIGDSVRQNRAHAEAVRARSAEQAVTAERLRIARELHDMIAHSIGVIAIQAGMGSRVIDTQPAEARAALTTIELTSRETLASLRRTLTALRKNAPDGGGSGPELAPAPGLADLDRLTASTAGAGVTVSLRRDGQLRPLPPDIDLAAYRIVQESLTNVVRHAGTDRCRVTIAYGKVEVRLRVEDGPQGGGATWTGAGQDAAGPHDGFGIAGMRERVALLRGGFTAGPRPGGGFRVEARLPLPPEQTGAGAASEKAAS